MKCSDCGTAKAKYDDPRDPPLDEGKCLCKDCYVSALEEVIDQLTEDIKDMKADLAAVDPNNSYLKDD